MIYIDTLELHREIFGGGEYLECNLRSTDHLYEKKKYTVYGRDRKKPSGQVELIRVGQTCEHWTEKIPENTFYYEKNEKGESVLKREIHPHYKKIIENPNFWPKETEEQIAKKEKEVQGLLFKHYIMGIEERIEGLLKAKHKLISSSRAIKEEIQELSRLISINKMVLEILLKRKI